MTDITPEQAQEIWEQHKAIWKPRMDAEEAAVRQLGDQIGYGRMMQAAEKIWGDKNEAAGLPRGSAHSVGPCAVFLVPCPHIKDEWDGWRDANGHCDWCCGAGRVTERVAQAMRDLRKQAT